MKIDLSKWPDRFIYTASDSIAAFRELARKWRLQFNRPVIGVAGSVGKTTTKELIAALLSGRSSKILKTGASHNGFVGIPMTLMRLENEHEFAVIEIGIDEPNAMLQHYNLVHPDLSILTVTGPEHLEKLGDIANAAFEELVLIKNTLKSGKRAVLNLDDFYSAKFLSEEKLNDVNIIGFTMHDETAKKFARQIGEIFVGNFDAISASLEIRSSNFDLTLKSPLPGAHNAANLVGAAAVASSLGLNAQEIRQGLANFKTPDGRSEVKELKTGQILICDHYNANPSSVRAALQMGKDLHIKRSKKGGKFWVCLGDMLELGKFEEKMHRDLATDLQSENVDEIILVGHRMKWLSDEMKSRNFKGSFVHFDQHDDASNKIKQFSKPEDTILVKGSRGLKMEKIITALVN